MTALKPNLASRVLIADGAWATELHARGFPREIPAECANLTAPDRVTLLARDYLEAGARFLTTNTFAANAFHAQRRGIEQDLAELNRAGAELAQAATRGFDATVAGCIGPSGTIVAVGEARPEKLTRAFSEQAEALAAGGADLILLETFSELKEMLIALEAVKQAAGLPVIASMTYDTGPQRTRTLMGSEAGECAAALEDAGAEIVGCNCGAGVATMLPVVVALRSNTKLPLWVKPSAGLPDLEHGLPVYTQNPEEFCDPIPTLLEAGASIIGGCCGTGPDHIRRLSAVVEGWLRKRK